MFHFKLNAKGIIHEYAWLDKHPDVCPIVSKGFNDSVGWCRLARPKYCEAAGQWPTYGCFTVDVLSVLFFGEPGTLNLLLSRRGMAFSTGFPTCGTHW